MGILLLLFAIVGFGFGAFWTGGLTFVFLKEKNTPLYVSIPLSALAGILGGIVCGAALGFGMAYIMLPRR